MYIAEPYLYMNGNYYATPMLAIPQGDYGKLTVGVLNDSHGLGVYAMVTIKYIPPSGGTQSHVSSEITFIPYGETFNFIPSTNPIFGLLGSWFYSISVTYKEGFDGEWEHTPSKTGFIGNVVEDEPPGTLAGSFTQKLLSTGIFDDDQPIPRDDIPLGENGRVNIMVSNDSGVPVKMDITWWVWDPDGIMVFSYNHTTTVWIQPGSIKEFYNDIFDFYEGHSSIQFDKTGDYTIEVVMRFLEDGGEWEEVLRWPGAGATLLCTVVGATPGTANIESVEVEYYTTIFDRTQEPIPASGITTDKKGYIHIDAYNGSIAPTQFSIEIDVTKPDGSVYHYDDTESGTTGVESTHHFVAPDTWDFALEWDQQGSWYITAILKADGVEVDRISNQLMANIGYTEDDVRFESLVVSYKEGE